MLLSRLIFVLLYVRLAVGKRYLREMPEISTLVDVASYAAEIESKRVSRGVCLKEIAIVRINDKSAPLFSQFFFGIFS